MYWSRLLIENKWDVEPWHFVLFAFSETLTHNLYGWKEGHVSRCAKLFYWWRKILFYLLLFCSVLFLFVKNCTPFLNGIKYHFYNTFSRFRTSYTFYFWCFAVWKLFADTLQNKKLNMQWQIYTVKFWTPPQFKFFQFNTVFGKFWQNRMSTPPRRVGTPISRKS